MRRRGNALKTLASDAKVDAARESGRQTHARGRRRTALVERRTNKYVKDERTRRRR